MFGYGSKYLNVYFKIRAYCSQICTANDKYKMFKTINDSRNISPKEIKHKTCALRMAYELEKPDTKCSKRHITL